MIDDDHAWVVAHNLHRGKDVLLPGADGLHKRNTVALVNRSGDFIGVTEDKHNDGRRFESFQPVASGVAKARILEDLVARESSNKRKEKREETGGGEERRRRRRREGGEKEERRARLTEKRLLTID